MNKCIAIIGPESTGKSQLSEALAAHYKTRWVPEYARTYLAGLQHEYTFDDLFEIAKGQIASEEELTKENSGYLFCDTDLIVIKIWSLHKYGKCHDWILNQIENRRYKLHLLTAIDLPWEFDPMREHPHLRKFFFDWFEKELNEYHFPYCIIKGTHQERANNAIAAIESFFGK